MKIVTILGSPKLERNTAKVLAMVERELGEGHEIDRVDLPRLDVMGCQGCYACQQNPDEPSCVIKDDASGVLRRIAESDAIVYASPLYMWGLPSKLHALLERHLSLVTGYGSPRYKSLIEGKRAAFLLTCAGPVDDNADAVQIVFDRIASYGKVDLTGKYIVPGCTMPDSLPDAAEAAAKQLAADLTA